MKLLYNASRFRSIFVTSSAGVNILRPFILLIFLALSTASAGQDSTDSLQANGFAKYNDANGTPYIGALFLETPSSAPTEIILADKKRLEIKITTEKLSHRQFKRALVNAAAINNAKAALQENATAMEEFLHHFRGNLNRGDHIVLTTTESGLDVFVNTVLLLSLESSELFNIILNTWIGSVPPSSNFKQQILGLKVDPLVVEDFTSIQFAESRQTIAELWKSELVEIDGKVIAETELQTEEKQAAKAILEAELREAAQREKKRLQKLAAEEKQRLQQLAEKEAESSVTVADAAENAPSLLDQLEVIEASNITDYNLLQDESDEALRLSDDQLFSSNLVNEKEFTSKLMIHSQSNITYPTVSRRLGHQDTITASITIDRRGKLVAYALVDESEYRALNVEVKKAIRRSAPYPKIPEKIEGDTYTFRLPVVFALE